jgi:hypothetical protein
MNEPNEDQVRAMSPRQALRSAIRAELAKYEPLEGSRSALELIGEASVSIVEGDAATPYRILGPDGKPRTVVKDGTVTDFTIADLAAELRDQHPTLFRAAAPSDADRASARGKPGEAGSDGRDRSSDAAAARAPPPQRDWLHLATDEPRTRGPIRIRLAAAVAALGSSCAEAANRLAPQLRSAPGSFRAKLSSFRESLSTHAARLRSKPPRLPLLRPRYAFAAVAAGLGLFAGVYLLGNLSSHRPTAKSDGPGAEFAAPRRRSEPAATGAVAPSPAKAPAAPTAAPDGAIRGVPEVIDTATLRLDGKIVHLFGVEWAKGGQVEDFTRYLNGREVACLAAGATDLYRCEVEGRDLSEVVLFNGGGRATAAASPELVAAENHAKTERIGVWRK